MYLQSTDKLTLIWIGGPVSHCRLGSEAMFGILGEGMVAGNALLLIIVTGSRNVIIMTGYSHAVDHFHWI